ncbi:MAG: DUF1549 domain-containing protein, partial [Planctomycetota bacterium]|nr:DUF1549 domain-containing protein [Planctomycetota bacterium]
MNHSLSGLIAALGWVLFCSWTTAGTPANAQQSSIEFNRDIRPILSDRCFQCHGPDDQKREGNIRFDLETEAKKNLGGYRAIVPGDSQHSELVTRIFSEDSDERMPPEISGKSLSAAEKELLKQWINQGAEFQKHWSFQKPVAPPLPKVQDQSWPVNEIDFFVLNKLELNKVQPSPRADERTLVRRLYIDLIGLLPSPQEVNDYVKDPSNQAYEKLVNRLLASKHFGERMGRH